MIILTILFLLFSNSVTLRRDLSILFNRIAIIALIYSTLHEIASLTILSKSISLHGGLLHVTNITQIFHVFIFFTSILILELTSFYFHFKMRDYPLILLFIVSGSIFLISINDLVSIFILIELQNYGWYLLSVIYRNYELSTTEGIRNLRVKILFNQISKVRFYSILTAKKTQTQLIFKPRFITGFTDAEACFSINIYRKNRYKTGWTVQPRFIIEVNQKDLDLLYKIKAFFGGIGSITSRKNVAIFSVSGIKDLTVIINHFDKYPLITKKQADYLLFKMAIDLIDNNEHLSMEGLQKIVNIRASMNKGLSNELKVAFPKIIPIDRPSVLNCKIQDPSWLAGFTSGEGCFFVNIINSSSYRQGFQVLLVFQITQHIRDEQLIRSLIEYLNCGNIYKRQDVYDFKVTKYSDLTNKILPFFNNYPIQGNKSRDYQDWCRAVEIVKSKDHLTKEGLDNIIKIKAGMNRNRS